VVLEVADELREYVEVGGSIGHRTRIHALIEALRHVCLQLGQQRRCLLAATRISFGRSVRGVQTAELVRIVRRRTSVGVGLCASTGTAVRAGVCEQTLGLDAPTAERLHRRHQVRLERRVGSPRRIHGVGEASHVRVPAREQARVVGADVVVPAVARDECVHLLDHRQRERVRTHPRQCGFQRLLVRDEARVDHLLLLLLLLQFVGAAGGVCVCVCVQVGGDGGRVRVVVVHAGPQRHGRIHRAAAHEPTDRMTHHTAVGVEHIAGPRLRAVCVQIIMCVRVCLCAGGGGGDDVRAEAVEVGLT
jgi:hypothetical protein